MFKGEILAFLQCESFNLNVDIFLYVQFFKKKVYLSESNFMQNV